MVFVELFLVALSLSMDAFAVALCQGLGMRKLHMPQAMIIALFFGIFQGGMPLLGWLLGRQFAGYITAYDHWIAFGLLLFIGGEMIFGAFIQDNRTVDRRTKLNIRDLFLMAIATSIDALAIGVTFAFLQTRILPAVLLIGIITFLLSLLGVIMGNRFGARFRKKAELGGGIVLILIGTKILFDHLGLI